MNLNGRTLLYGFLAGALAVLVFHQGTVLILWLAGLTANAPWRLTPAVPPLGVPLLINQMFWGGLWGLAYAALAHRLPVRSVPGRGVLFGLLGPYLIGNGLLVPLLRGNGQFIWTWGAQRLLIGALIAGAFGLGVAVILNALGRR